METQESFQNSIYPWSLIFKDESLERKYHSNRENERMRKGVLWVASIFSFLGIIVTGFVAWGHVEKKENTLFVSAIYAIVSAAIGVALEIVLNCTTRLKFLRGLFFPVGTQFACLVYDFEILWMPAIFLGDVIAICGGVICSAAVSLNWMTTSGYLFLEMGTAGLYICIKYNSSLTANMLFQSFGFYLIGLILFPVFFRYLEYEKRAVFFAFREVGKETKFWKDISNNLPVGIVISKGQEVVYYNTFARDILFGESVKNIASTELKGALQKMKGASPPSYSLYDILLGEQSFPVQTGGLRLVYEIGIGEEKRLAGSFLRLRKNKENYRACILQDQKVLDELESEKIKNQLQKSFLAMITHELRNPLHGVMGIIEILQEHIKDDEMLHQCRVGINTGKRMMTLINDILDISQLEANKLSLAEESFCPITAAEESIEIMKFQADKKKLFLTHSHSDPIPDIVNDRGRYSQIIINLVSNAIKFTEKGGISINQKYNEESKTLITSVSDTGTGISSDQIKSLFTMYEKLTSGTNNPRGAGIGLTVSKGLAEQMGGSFSVESEIGKGSTFYFTIKNLSKANPIISQEERKVAEPQPQKEKRKSQNKLSQLHKKTDSLTTKELLSDDRDTNEAHVLIIDDDFASSSVLFHLCKMLNIPAETACSGEEGLEKLASRLKAHPLVDRFKLFFVDMYMPGKSGIETASCIKQEYEKNGFEAIIIGLSGDSNKELKQSCLDCGMKDLLVKPFGKEQVKSLIAKHYPKC